MIAFAKPASRRSVCRARSTPAGHAGFLRLLAATLAAHPFYARLLEYCEQIGGYRTVWEEAME